MNILYVLVPTGAVMFYQTWRINRLKHLLNKGLKLTSFICTMATVDKKYSQEELFKMISAFDFAYDHNLLEDMLTPPKEGDRNAKG